MKLTLELTVPEWTQPRGTDSWHWVRLSAEELMVSNCGAGEDTWESLGHQGDQTSQPWMFIGRTDAEAEAPILWCKEPTHWKRPWCWERLKAWGEGDERGWVGWMASLTQGTCVLLCIYAFFFLSSLSFGMPSWWKAKGLWTTHTCVQTHPMHWQKTANSIKTNIKESIHWYHIHSVCVS